MLIQFTGPYIMKRLLFVLILVFSGGFAHAQEEDVPLYEFVKPHLNLLDNDLQGLAHLYTQLIRLENGQLRKVNVVHIGDSHIQADFFSGALRMAMQKRFGSAGRGLIFPYRIGKTNGPGDIQAQTNVDWKAKRLIFTKERMPVGISGMTIRTSTPQFSLKLGVGKNPNGIDYRFDKITLFHDKGPQNFEWDLASDDLTVSIPPVNRNEFQPATENPNDFHVIKAGETVSDLATEYNCTFEEIRKWNHLEDDVIFVGQKLRIHPPENGYLDGTTTGQEPQISSVPLSTHSFATSISLPESTQTVQIEGKKTRPEQKHATFYGMVLENTQKSGILFHMIGVNGATFLHYNMYPDFFSQLKALDPDIIIVSLGTNESFDPSFSGEKFKSSVRKFVQYIRNEVPKSSILLTTPPDARRSSQSVNPNVAEASNILLQFTLDNGLGCWNFFEIMGRNGSIDKWYRNKLAQKDHLHLTRKGYELQSQLLFNALMGGYAAFKTLDR